MTTRSRSESQSLFIKGECAFLLLNSLICGLFISSANSLLQIISFLIADLFPVAKFSDRGSVAALPEDFLSKDY